ncbi:MAG: hypothetical protein KC496_08875 [Anaerolineae bacterium]|nr:hypothetical protein [Anaerolineae bacterium]
MADVDNFDLEDNGLSPEEEARQEAFLKEVNKRRHMLRKPKNFPAAERLEAAKWLGEAGDPSAIPELILVYQKDKTPGMKDAAGYSLGMMKALGEALNDPDEADHALELTRDIVLHGKFGRAGRRLRPLLLLLTLTFIGIMAVVVLTAPSDDTTIAAGGITQEAESSEEASTEASQQVAAADTSVPTEIQPPTATPEPTRELSVTEQMGVYFSAMQEDAAVLHEQFTAVFRQGQMQNCSVTFNNPDAFTVPAGVENQTRLQGISIQMNAVRDSLTPVIERYQEACLFRQQFTRDEAQSLDDIVVEAQRALNQDIRPLFDSVGVLAPTSESPNGAEPTQDISVARVHITTLEDIIIDMTGLRGEAARIQTYWNDIQQFGTSEGCFQGQPFIPEAYELPQNIASEFPTLQTATDLVNTGLALTRQASDAFFTACNNGTLEQDLEAYLEQANGALTAFENAQTLLDDLRRGR